MQRLQPILYKKISIHSENQARRLIESLTSRSKTVIYLFVGTPIKPNTTVKLLRRCPLLISLVLYAGGNNCSRFSALLQSVNDLPHLKYFSVDPIALFKTRFVHLPNASIFHRVTHLDLTTHWTWEAVTRGFNYLYHLTHLSITWQQSRYSTDPLRELLDRPDFKMLVLWSEDIETHSLIVTNLVKRELDDARVVLLHRASRWALRVDGGFWLHAERILAWRKDKKSEYPHVCILQKPKTHLLQLQPWHVPHPTRI